MPHRRICLPTSFTAEGAIVSPRVPREEAYVWGHPLSPGTVVWLFEDLGDGYLAGDGVVEAWDESRRAWRVCVKAEAVVWHEGKVPVPVVQRFYDSSPPPTLASQKELRRFVPELTALAEGAVEPRAWMEWWRDHWMEVESACDRETWYWFAPEQRDYDARNVDVGHRYSLEGHDEAMILRDTAGYQDRAQVVVEALGGAAAPRRVYWDEVAVAESRVEREREEKEAALKRDYLPVVQSLLPVFPKLARFLKSRLGEVEAIRKGLAEKELVTLEESLGISLPGAYRKWLQLVRELWIGSLHLEEPTIRNLEKDPIFRGKMLWIGEYWLEADGDAVLFDLTRHSGDDPPVFYFAHEVPCVRRLSPSFTKWIEGLPRGLGNDDD